MFDAYKANTLQYNPEKCIGCEMCVYVCPHNVFIMQGRLAQLAHSEACMECGACQINCPTDALVVESGVGCAAAMMRAALLHQKEVACG
jgi:NAD-dependent dihydropyrimidine dehydrogenase PreA subunit